MSPRHSAHRHAAASQNGVQGAKGLKLTHLGCPYVGVAVTLVVSLSRMDHFGDAWPHLAAFNPFSSLSAATRQCDCGRIVSGLALLYGSHCLIYAMGEKLQ